MTSRRLFSLPFAIAILLGQSIVLGADAPAKASLDPRIARDDAFPDPAGAKRISGELIHVEHVNRLGILRPDRDRTINNYHWDLPHQFNLLPYASIFYHGAAAELDDVPLGTHLHGIFYLGAEGDFEVKPPETDYHAIRMPNPDLRSVESRYSRGLRLEDDFSYFMRLGHGWKIAELGPHNSTLTVERVNLADGRPIDEKKFADGVKSRQKLRLDRGASIWKGRQIADVEDVAVGQVVQINFAWVDLLGASKQDALCKEIWIDEESRKIATERQRQVYIADMKRRGVPAIVLNTEHIDGKGAMGNLTIALYAGVDQELIDAIQPKKSIMAVPVEPTLRSYGVHGQGIGDIDIRRIANPPPGHSGVEIRAICWEMLEGYRAGRTIRLFRQDWEWPRTQLPREELMHPNDSRSIVVNPKPLAHREVSGK